MRFAKKHCFRPVLPLSRICPGNFSETIGPISKIFFQKWLVYIWSLYPIEIFENITSGCDLDSIFGLFRTLFLNNYQRYWFEIFFWVIGERLELYYLTNFIVLSSNWQSTPEPENSGQKIRKLFNMFWFIVFS